MDVSKINHAATSCREGRELMKHCFLFTLLVLSATSTLADDRLALSAIFDEQHVHGTALDVHRAAMSMPPEARFAYLSEWLLPGDDHIVVRVEAAFPPVNPAPVTDLPENWAIVSPMLDLVDVAGELGRLEELRNRVGKQSLIPGQADSSLNDELTRHVVLALIELAAKRPEAAIPF